MISQENNEKNNNLRYANKISDANKKKHDLRYA